LSGVGLHWAVALAENHAPGMKESNYFFFSAIVSSPSFPPTINTVATDVPLVHPGLLVHEVRQIDLQPFGLLLGQFVQNGAPWFAECPAKVMKR
jgi:hypothetical protein